MLNVYQNVWFYDHFHLILGMGGFLGSTMSIAETYRFEDQYIVGSHGGSGNDGSSGSSGSVMWMAVLCLYGRGLAMCLTGIGLTIVNGSMLDNAMQTMGRSSGSSGSSSRSGSGASSDASSGSSGSSSGGGGGREMMKYNSLAFQEDGEGKCEDETTQVGEKGMKEEEDKTQEDEQHVVIVGRVVDEKKEAIEWLKVGHWSLILYAVTFGFLLLCVQVTGSQMNERMKASMDQSALITGELLGFDVAWHVLFFGVLVAWHGLMTKNLLTLGIATGLVCSTCVTCAVGGWLIMGQESMSFMMVALWLGSFSSMYLLINCLKCLNEMFE